MSFIITLIAERLGLGRVAAGAVAWLAIALVAAGVIVGGYRLIKQQGADELRAKIERDNQDAIRNGIEASLSLDDCIAAGGVWDFRRGRCASPALGHR